MLPVPLFAQKSVLVEFLDLGFTKSVLAVPTAGQYTAILGLFWSQLIEKASVMAMAEESAILNPRICRIHR